MPSTCFQPRILAAVLCLAFGPGGFAGILDRGAARLICHRTANRDVPENTLESLAFAARMGCGVVELDLRVTKDAQIVLHHDGILERLTDGMGDVETSYFEELEMLDAGSWMTGRFRGLRIPRFIDALHLAKERRLKLVLDLKDRGMAPLLLPILKSEEMLGQVRFDGEYSDIKDEYSDANGDQVVLVEPPVSPERVREIHTNGKVAIANFSANGHEMDLAGMRAAVAAGVDWINVDHPRLGSDAIGEPVETKIAGLVKKASGGTPANRAEAVLELGHYHGFPLQPVLERFLLTGDEEISHAAAVALLTIEPTTPQSLFVSALHSASTTARKNAAWALGMESAPEAESLSNLLFDRDPGVLQETLLAISRCAGSVPASRLTPLLKHENPRVRGAAALALARHHPEIAAQVIPQVLLAEEASIAKDHELYVNKGSPPLSQSEIDVTVNLYRCLMKMIESGTAFRSADALAFFNREAFRFARDYSSTIAPVAAYQLWDRLAADPQPAITALASADVEVANRAEWALAKAGPAVLPAVRLALRSPHQALQERAVRVLVWQEDSASLPLLQVMRNDHPANVALLDWAISRIQTFTSIAK